MTDLSRTRAPLSACDPASAALLNAEIARQQESLELIPSENYASAAVREALGSVFTNVYSEGYPGARYYGGQAVVDDVERLAIARAQQLFGADHVNVQPYSGSGANAAAYFALLQPGDTILSMDLAHGGHISHGLSRSYSGRTYTIAKYGVDPATGRIDLEAVRAQAHAVQPKLLLAGFSAYPRTIDWAAFRAIADEVGALFMADMAHIAGLVAAGVLVSPVPFADIVTCTTHKTLRGPRGGLILSKEQYGAAIDKAIFPGFQGGPHDHATLAKAVCFHEAMQPAFRTYAEAVLANAQTMAETLLECGHTLVSGGTENHLLLLDVRPLGLGGKRAQELLETAGLTVNKNIIPGDTGTPSDPSGIRLGTPALTTRGLDRAAARQVARWIDQLLRAPEDAALHAQIRADVHALCLRYPPPA